MAESARTFWKGFLRIALVTIPVKLVSAVKSGGEVTFHQVHRESKQRIRYQKTAPGVGPVSEDDIVRGYEVEPGQYVLLEDEELDALKLATRHTIDVTQFVSAADIPAIFFDKPYYVLPDGEMAAEGYRVIRDALRAQDKVGIGQLTLRGKEQLVALHCADDGLVIETLRYANEIKNAHDIFADLGHSTPSRDMVEMAQNLIAQKTGDFDPGQYRNHYAEALKELVREKIQGGHAVAIETEKERAPSTVVDFMEALKRSVAAGQTQPKAAPPRKAREPEPKRKGGGRSPARPASASRRKAG